MRIRPDELAMLSGSIDCRKIIEKARRDHMKELEDLVKMASLPSLLFQILEQLS